MMKRNEQGDTASREEFASSAGKGVGAIESVVEVESVSHAEAEVAEAPSPSSVPTSDFERVVSPSRLDLEPVFRAASPPALRGALCIFRCRTKLELSRLYLVKILRDD